jgi:PAS domain S-box-containing protein
MPSSGPSRGELSADAQVLLQRQTEVLELIAATAPLRTTLDRLLISLEELLVTARCSVLLLDRDGRTLRHGAAPGLPESYVAAIDGMAIGPSAGSCGTAAYRNEPVVAADIRSDERWRDFRSLADRAGLRSCWSTPIVGRSGNPIGTFAVYHEGPHQPTPRQQRLVARFTHLAAVAIEHAQLVGDLVESEERFRRAFDDNAAAMVLLSRDLEVEQANSAMRQLTGRTRADIVGRPFVSLLPEEDQRHLQRQLAGLAARRIHDLRLESGVQQEDGGCVPVELTASPVLATSGSPHRLCVTMLDMTARHTAEAAERARREADVARRTAEENSRAKSELLTTVSHEVRTPLQAITGFAEQLTTLELDDARRREALDGITTAAGHVMELVTDVLDLSRIESRALPIDPEDVSVAALFREVHEVLCSTADQRGTSLTVDAGDVRVHGDPLRLRQVLLNLVANALRHGRRDGRVEVVAGRSGSRAVIEVRDDGPGIPQPFLPHIFDPFTRAPDAHGADGADGYGLGLSLAHALVEAMDGTLEVRSTGPAGTVMAVDLPAPTP